MIQPDRDTDGITNRPIMRFAAASKGWVYLAHTFELETSVLASNYSKDWQGTDTPGVTLKFYNTSDVEITTQETADTDCVKTVLTFKPSYDYEIISGYIHQVSSPSTDVRVWVIGGALELGAAGVKEFVRGLNLHYMGADEHIETDGRASKYMAKTTPGVPYDTNQMQFIIKHNAGVKHKLMFVMEYFRA